MKRAKRKHWPEAFYCVLVHPDNSDAVRSLVGDPLKRIRHPWLIPGYIGTLDSQLRLVP